MAGTAWLELLLVVDDGQAVGAKVAGAVPRLSDSGLVVSLAPPVDKRLARLRAMGADTPAPSDAPRAAAPTGRPRPARMRVPALLGVLARSRRSSPGACSAIAVAS